VADSIPPPGRADARPPGYPRQLYVNRIEAGDGTISIPAGGRVIVSFTHSPKVSQADGLRLIEEMIGGMYRDGPSGAASPGRAPREFVCKRPRPPPGYATPADHPLPGSCGKRRPDAGPQNIVGFVAENVLAMHRPGSPV
jgi:hypothetical protein